MRERKPPQSLVGALAEAVCCRQPQALGLADSGLLLGVPDSPMVGIPHQEPVLYHSEHTSGPGGEMVGVVSAPFFPTHPCVTTRHSAKR